MNKYHIEARIHIHAPIEKVWKVMTEIGNYPEWNRFIRNIQASAPLPVEKTNMKFTVQFPSGKKTSSHELVKSFMPPAIKNNTKEAEWIYDFTGFLHTIGMVRASRLQKLVERKDGTTEYYTIEKFSGWGKIFLPLKNVQAGFIIHSEDLKKHCEKN